MSKAGPAAGAARRAAISRKVRERVRAIFRRQRRRLEALQGELLRQRAVIGRQRELLRLLRQKCPECSRPLSVSSWNSQVLMRSCDNPRCPKYRRPQPGIKLAEIDELLETGAKGG